MERERVRARYEGVNNIIVEDKEQARDLYYRGYGVLDSKERLLLASIEAVYLVEKKMLSVIRDGKEISSSEILEEAGVKNPEEILRYIVYKDLRDKGRLAKAELNTNLIRLYSRGAEIGEKAAHAYIYSVSEDKPIEIKKLMKVVDYGISTRKKAILAVIDDELSISYYAMEKITPEKIRELRLEEKTFEACVMHDRVIIWDYEQGNELYRIGFFGHPMGIRKPKPGEKYIAPYVLSLFEGIFLMKNGVLKLHEAGTGRELSEDELLEILTRMREKGRSRYLVYEYWRERGYIVKPASKYGVDFITTNRFLYYEKGAWTPVNFIGNKILTLLHFILFKLRVKDSQSGMWCFKRSLLKCMKLSAWGMEFSSEIKIEGHRCAKRFIEIPIIYGKRKYGKPKLKWLQDGLRILTFLIKKKLLTLFC